MTVCERLLENTREKFNGCWIWQGAVNEQGFGYAKVHGHTVLVHRYLKLYHVDRTEEQVVQLKKFRLENTCGHSVCVRPEHWDFKTGPKVREYEPLVKWWQT